MAFILLVEDDTWLGESYQKTLSAEHEVIRVETLEDAVAAVDTRLPDLILADFILDGRNSLELLHELNSYSDTVRIPIILCSSLGAEIAEHKGHLKAYGVKAIYDKAELTPTLLKRVVHETLHEVSS